MQRKNILKWGMIIHWSISASHWDKFMDWNPCDIDSSIVQYALIFKCIVQHRVDFIFCIKRKYKIWKYSPCILERYTRPFVNHILHGESLL